MQTDENKWVTPTEAYYWIRFAHGLTGVGKQVPFDFMSEKSMRKDYPRRKGPNVNPMQLQVVSVHLGDYVQAAKAAKAALEALAAERANRPANALEALERRVAALEAAFDALITTTKEAA